MNTSLAVVAILSTWLAAGVVIVGLGLGWRRLLTDDALDARSLIETFWLGVAVLMTALVLLNFVSPLASPAALAAIIALAMPGLITARRELLAVTRDTLRRHPRSAAGFGLLVLYVAYRATGPCTWYDSAMYHLHLVEWAATNPLVPGLSNLQVRFAANNAGLLLAALFEVGHWTARSQHLVSGLLTIGLVPFPMSGLAALRRGERDLSSTFDAMLIGPIAAFAWDEGPFNLGSLSPDLQATTLALAATAIALRRVRTRGEIGIVALPILAAAATAKLSAAVYAAALGVFLILASSHTSRRERAWAGVLCGLLLSAWVGRGVVLSGMLLYPVARTRLAVDWALPAANLERARANIADETRARLSLPAGDPWLRNWLRHRWSQKAVHSFWTPLALGAVGLLVLIARPRAYRRLLGWHAYGLALAASVSLAAVFASAPTPRHMALEAWVLAGLTLALLARSHRHGPRLVVGLCLALAAAPAGARWLQRSLWRPGEALAVARELALVAPGEDSGLHALPNPDLRLTRTRSGLAIHLPYGLLTNGQLENRIWRPPLLATSQDSFDPGLTLRRTGDLRGGFRIEPGPSSR